MNRIVRERYPVSKLPEDLRTGLVADRPVSVIIVQDDVGAVSEGSQEPVPGGDFTRFEHLRRANFASSADVDAYVDELRHEWAHRER